MKRKQDREYNNNGSKRDYEIHGYIVNACTKYMCVKIVFLFIIIISQKTCTANIGFPLRPLPGRQFFTCIHRLLATFTMSSDTSVHFLGVCIYRGFNIR